MLYWGGSLQDFLPCRRQKITVSELRRLTESCFPERIEDFLTWAESQADPAQYYERAIPMVGVLAVTRRKIWFDFLKAVLGNDIASQKAILTDFAKQEQNLFRHVNRVYQKQLASAMRLGGKKVCVVELGCGLGQFTEHWLPQAARLGIGYSAYDQSPRAVAETRHRLGFLGIRERHIQRVQVGNADEISKALEERCSSSFLYLFPDIRLDLHITADASWHRFMSTIGSLGYRVLHAQTAAGRLSEKRPRNPGTKFRTEQEVQAALGMIRLSQTVIDHHGDPFVISDFANSRYC